MNNEHISHIHKLNIEHIASTQPHILYADNTGCRLELRTHTIKRLMGEVSGRSGVILGMTHGWNGGSQTQIFFLESEGSILSIGQYGRFSQASLDIMLLYMLLNPLEYIDGWVHQDIDQAKREQAPKTHPMIGIKTSWGKTQTFYPDLQEAIQNSIAIIRGIS